MAELRSFSGLRVIHSLPSGERVLSIQKINGIVYICTTCGVYEGDTDSDGEIEFKKVTPDA